MSRVCTETGLALLSEPATGFRVAKSSYGPVNPVFRPVESGSRTHWSRFDTVGTTLYLAEDRRTAYAETLSWARMTPEQRKSLQKAADFAGISLAQMSAEVRDDWERSGKMAPGWIPTDWREGRLLYDLHIEQPGEWIDLTAAESLAAINRSLGEELGDLYGESFLTLSTLTGDNREVTTLIAAWLREQVLDSGEYALGVKFHSKHGGGLCWAYWMRRSDDGLGPEKLTVLTAAEIEPTDADYRRVLEMFDINSR